MNDDIPASEPCRDCCCAKAWKALGITEYTGKSIPEEIQNLRAEARKLGFGEGMEAKKCGCEVDGMGATVEQCGFCEEQDRIVTEAVQNARMEGLRQGAQDMLDEMKGARAKSVREEREACAKYTETFFAHWTRSLTLHDVDDLAAAIRARGQTYVEINREKGWK